MKRRQRRPVLELNQTQTSSHGEFVQNNCKQIPGDHPGQHAPANPLANLLCHYNSDSDTEDSKKDVRKLDDQVNNFLKEIQLIAPKDLAANDSSNPGTTGQHGSMWRECIDESTGYPYYWHIETNEVTWEMPDELRALKNAPKVSSAAKPPLAQDSHWVDFSSRAYQSHENIPEGMIPREVVARNRNRYIRNETVQKHDAKTDQEAANTSDAMDDDSDDGKIEMITSYGSEESDSDTESRHVAPSEPKRPSSKTKGVPAAPVTLPRPKHRAPSQEREAKVNNARMDPTPEAKSDAEEAGDRKEPAASEEKIAKAADPEVDFRISLVPGYDEDSDAEDEVEVKEERKALFPIPQNENSAEGASSLLRGLPVKLVDEEAGVPDSNDSDALKRVEEEGEKNLEKVDGGGDSLKTTDETKLNKFVENLYGRPKCFQRKKRIAFEVPSNKAKPCDDSEASKPENEVANEVSSDNEPQDAEKAEAEQQEECNSGNEDAEVKSNVREESNDTEEETISRCDTPGDSKEDEEQVNILTQIVLEKLKFLSEGKQSVSPVQLMAIQLQTLFVAWEGGFLEKNYLRRWLTNTSHELERLEQDAAPPGWLCQWDRSHKRYYYQNASTGVTQWTYPDTGIAGGTEEMEICSTPPPVEQEEITSPVEGEKTSSKPKTPKDDCQDNGEPTEPRQSDIEPPPPPQISNPSPPPPPRIFAEDLKKDKRKRDVKSNDKCGNKKKCLGEEMTAVTDGKLENPSHSGAPLSPQSSVLPTIGNTEPLPPGVDLSETAYEVPAAALKRIIYGVQPQGNAIYEASTREAVPILGHPAALVQEHYLQYPAYHQHMHAPTLVLPHKHSVQPAIQLIPDYTPIYTNHKVIEKPPVKTAKESLVSALDSFYSDIARIESSVVEPPRQVVPVAEPLPPEEPKEPEQEPLPEVAVKEKKRKKARVGISKKHKEVSTMVAKWQKAQQNFEDNT